MMKASSKLWVFCNLLAASMTFLALAVASYLLWRTQLASRPVNIGADVLKCGMSSSALAILLSALMSATPPRRYLICYLLSSTSALGIIMFLYLSQLACSMKKVGICEPLFLF